MEERIIYWVVALLIWIPLVSDQYLLDYKSIEGKITHFSEGSGSGKHFKTATIKLKEANRIARDYSVNPEIVQNISINSSVTIYESRLLFRVIAVEQNGVSISNQAGGMNMVILIAIFLLPLYAVLAFSLKLFRKIKNYQRNILTRSD